MSNKVALTFDDILLVPVTTSVASRLDVNLGVKLSDFVTLKYPMMSAAMDTVTAAAMAGAMDTVGGMGIIHRFQTVDDRIYCANVLPVTNVGIAIGLEDTKEDILRMADHCNLLALDIANAHAVQVGDKTYAISDWLKDYSCSLMVGNVATHIGAEQLISAGANIIKVGIGSGAACTTRAVTGFGMPMVTAIEKIALLKEEHKFTIVADGGIRTSGDIAKAIAVGADCVMVGRLLAGCPEAPQPGNYRGMASEPAQKDWKGTKWGTVPEGVSGAVADTESAEVVVERLMAGLRSAFTYGNATTIEEFQKYTYYVQVTPNCLWESGTRI